MTVEDALEVLAELFPPPRYTAAITIDTQRRVEMDVFDNQTKQECQNVRNNSGTLEECIADMRTHAESAKAWHMNEK